MRFSICILAILLSMTGFAQNSVVERTISGAISERNGEVVAGANVLVQSADSKRLFSYGSSDGVNIWCTSF